jgi:hypothetical protein
MRGAGKRIRDEIMENPIPALSVILSPLSFPSQGDFSSLQGSRA